MLGKTLDLEMIPDDLRPLSSNSTQCTWIKVIWSLKTSTACKYLIQFIADAYHPGYFSDDLGEKKKAINEPRRRVNAEEQSCRQSSWQLIKMMHHQDCCLRVTGSKLLLPAWHVRSLFATLNTWDMNVDWIHAKMWMDAEGFQHGSDWIYVKVLSLLIAPLWRYPRAFRWHIIGRRNN